MPGYWVECLHSEGTGYDWTAPIIKSTISHYTRACNFIYAHRRSVVFTSSISTKLTNALHKMCSSSYTEFHKTRTKKKHEKDAQRSSHCPHFHKTHSLETYFVDISCTKFYPKGTESVENKPNSKIRVALH